MLCKIARPTGPACGSRRSPPPSTAAAGAAGWPRRAAFPAGDRLAGSRPAAVGLVGRQRERRSTTPSASPPLGRQAGVGEHPQHGDVVGERLRRERGRPRSLARRPGARAAASPPRARACRRRPRTRSRRCPACRSARSWRRPTSLRAEPGQQGAVVGIGRPTDPLGLAVGRERAHAEEAQVGVVRRHRRVHLAHGFSVLRPGGPDLDRAPVGQQCVRAVAGVGPASAGIAAADASAAAGVRGAVMTRPSKGCTGGRGGNDHDRAMRVLAAVAADRAVQQVLRLTPESSPTTMTSPADPATEVRAGPGTPSGVCTVTVMSRGTPPATIRKALRGRSGWTRRTARSRQSRARHAGGSGPGAGAGRHGAASPGPHHRTATSCRSASLAALTAQRSVRPGRAVVDADHDALAHGGQHYVPGVRGRLIGHQDGGRVAGTGGLHGLHGLLLR